MKTDDILVVLVDENWWLFSNAILFNPVNIVQVPSSIDETKIFF